jgi:hypothetical protein
MKHIYMLFAVMISSLSLNAMVPDVTKWQKICKDPQEKQQLVTVYKDFCQKRLKNDMGCIVGSCTPFILKTVRNDPICVGLVVFLVGTRLMLAGSHSARNDVAQQEDLSYLNDDVLGQLGYPNVKENQVSFKTVSYAKINNSDLELQHDTIHVDTIIGIKKALSGNYKSCPDYGEDGYNPFAATSLMVKAQLKSMVQQIKDSIQ